MRRSHHFAQWVWRSFEYRYLLRLYDQWWKATGKYGSVGWHVFRHTYPDVGCH
jgi:hypothetical protein